MGGLFAGTPFERPVTCAVCDKPLADCRCPRAADGKVTLPKDQPARVSRERRGGGKLVTLISGLDPAATDCKALLADLKKQLACGGAVADGKVELQGDHRDRVVAMLRERGYPAKAAGG